MVLREIWNKFTEATLEIFVFCCRMKITKVRREITNVWEIKD